MYSVHCSYHKLTISKSPTDSLKQVLATKLSYESEFNFLESNMWVRQFFSRNVLHQNYE